MPQSPQTRLTNRTTEPARTHPVVRSVQIHVSGKLERTLEASGETFALSSLGPGAGVMTGIPGIPGTPGIPVDPTGPLIPSQPKQQRH